jgi:hypothetical protein
MTITAATTTATTTVRPAVRGVLAASAVAAATGAAVLYTYAAIVVAVGGPLHAGDPTMRTTVRARRLSTGRRSTGPRSHRYLHTDRRMEGRAASVPRHAFPLQVPSRAMVRRVPRMIAALLVAAGGVLPIVAAALGWRTARRQYPHLVKSMVRRLT